MPVAYLREHLSSASSYEFTGLQSSGRDEISQRRWTCNSSLITSLFHGRLNFVKWLLDWVTSHDNPTRKGRWNSQKFWTSQIELGVLYLRSNQSVDSYIPGSEVFQNWLTIYYFEIVDDELDNRVNPKEIQTMTSDQTLTANRTIHTLFGDAERSEKPTNGTIEEIHCGR